MSNQPSDVDGFDLPKAASAEDWDASETAEAEMEQEQEAAEKKADEVIEAVMTKGPGEPYPPESLAPMEGEHPAQKGVPPDEDDMFDLPDPNKTAEPVDGNGFDEESIVAESYQGTIPAGIRTAELQKAFFRARLVLHNCLDPVKRKDERSVLSALIEDDPAAYCDIVCRTAFTSFIAWQKANGF